MQFAENLPDRRTADAVRARIDWKYALGLELSDPGFDFSVLSEFRDRLLEGGAEELLLEKMLERFGERGWVKARGRQRTDSTHVLSAVRALNRIEIVGETMRAALNALAVAAPEWLRERAPEDWFSRYGRPVYDDLPKGISARKEYAESVGKDGRLLLSWIGAEGSPGWLGKIPAVELLEKIWENQYHLEGGEPIWREARELPRAGERLDSPYDPDARYGNKRSRRWSGYKLHLTETCDEDLPRIVTRVETTPAHLSDVSQTEKVHEELAIRGLLPREHVADAGFVDADLLVRSAQEHVRCVEHSIPGTGQAYVVSILDNYSRAILASAVTLSQDTNAYLSVLHAAIERHGSPGTIVTDGAGVFKSNRAKAVYRSLGIAKEEIEKRRPWQSFIETTFNMQRRMADFHFGKAGRWEEMVAEHDRWLASYNVQRHWAREGRKDGRRSPSEVLGPLTLLRHHPEDLSRAFFWTRFTRRLDPLVYARLKHWRVYGEEGLAACEVALWLGDGGLVVEYGGDTLSRYDVSFSPGSPRLGDVTNPRLFATKYRPPQLKLFALEEVLGEDGWLKALGLEGYGAWSRKMPGLLQGSLFSYLEAL